MPLAKNAEKLFESVMADFPDASTYRGKNHENAASLLKELRSPVAITKPALAVSGLTIDGAEFKLGNHKERVVVLAFSGHWCGPCVAMHPTMKKLVTKYQDERLTVVEINSDKDKNLDAVRKKIEADSLNWLVVPDGSHGPISKKWHVQAWPTYYVLDQNHRIRRRGTGNMGNKLIEWVDELMETQE